MPLAYGDYRHRRFGLRTKISTRYSKSRSRAALVGYQIKGSNGKIKVGHRNCFLGAASSCIVASRPFGSGEPMTLKAD
jgi:hypothetical protein